MKTPFYELAEKIGNDYQNGREDYFYPLKVGENDYFIGIFERFIFESIEHCLTALLFADLLWQDEMKGK